MNDSSSGAALQESHPALEAIDSAVWDHYSRIEQSNCIKQFLSGDLDAITKLIFMREVLLEVSSYGQGVIGSIFEAIARIPQKHIRHIRHLSRFALEETAHPGIAQRDFLRLGGNEAVLNQRLAELSPEAFAIVSVCRAIARDLPPYSILGFLYLAENLTPRFVEMAQSFVKSEFQSDDAGKFIHVHGIEEPEHIELLRKLIVDVIEEQPDAERDIMRGLQAFAAVYPVPLWERCLSRACESNSLPRTKETSFPWMSQVSFSVIQKSSFSNDKDYNKEIEEIRDLAFPTFGGRGPNTN